MPRTHPRQNCRICGEHREKVGDLSTRGKCRACATAMSDLNAIGLTTHSGPFFDHWRRRSVAAFGGVLLDDFQKAS